MDTTRSHRSSFVALRQFVRERAPVERCELCSAALAPDHQHLIAPASRQLLCCCAACAILFSGGEQTRYRRVPQRIRALPGFRISAAQWEGLGLPINLVFFFYSTPAGRVVALYPGPAGATESLLPLEAWAELVRENPVLAALEPDVEALLVNRVGGAQRYLLAPIDECYKLVGLIRANWRGVSGGTAAWEAIARCFDTLEERANA